MSRIEKAIEAAALKRKHEKVEQQGTASLTPAKAGSNRILAPMPDSPISSSITNPYLVTANNVNSPASEQYRKLKSLLVHLSQRGTFDNTLMVTSPASGEGKTITSLNLAITLSQEFDHTVLLVEADIRKPTVMHYLGLHAERGLTDCVLDGVDVSQVLVKTDFGNLTILPAGRQTSNPVEVFSSNRMAALFDEIKTRYNNRYVIVDTTPLLLFAEPQYIANMTDAVLLVAREGVTSPEKLKKSLEILKDNNLLGVVSNCVTRMTSLQSHYGYYG